MLNKNNNNIDKKNSIYMILMIHLEKSLTIKYKNNTIKF